MIPPPPQPPLPVGPEVGNKQPYRVLPLLQFIWHLKIFYKSIKNTIGITLSSFSSLITDDQKP